MGKNAGKKESSKNLVSFLETSRNQTFCKIELENGHQVVVAEIVKKDGKFQVNYMSSKLSDEIRKEITQKYEEIVSKN